ncbi:MAG: hypothetical protein A3F68_04300 [Acidobacteria bacterium RIFCSPLOWO2_12_FULL_54_10]|nr:MAG: hypothetical protein A3F68_04300 [Acidobacteria bacterium RIFCSPLOWO2_12_FULL_54_10]
MKILLANRNRQALWGVVVLFSLFAAGCGGGPATQPQEPGLSGTVEIDGSSTVFPIAEAIAEEFQKKEPGVRVTVGVSGTGGGFKRFGVGETDISNASRPISTSEMEQAAKNGVEYIELPIAFDGLSILVHPSNDFVTSLTVAELKKIWEPESKVRHWSDIRSGWPAREIHLYGPGHDSGTFDYFTEAIVGKAKSSRSDFTASEDDNVLVQGISGDADALGYFGYAYYAENQGKMKLIAVDAGQGPVLPSAQTISDGTYKPLSRPLLIYVSVKAAARPEVKTFIDFALEQAGALSTEVGFFPLTDSIYQLARQRFEKKVAGTVFGGKDMQSGQDLAQLLQPATN